MDQKNIVIIVLVIAVALLAGYFLFQPAAPSPVVQDINNTQLENTPPQNDTPDANINVDVNVNASKTYEVIYSDAGYSPSALAVKVGDTVTFKNQSSDQVWTGSAMHPAHTVYSGTTLQQHCPDVTNSSFDQCEDGGPQTSWSFTFNKVGSWGYHNHSNAKHFGKITVE